MGMFDEVLIECPHCKATCIVQSKAGDCSLAQYSLQSTPTTILADIEEDNEVGRNLIYCSECTKTWKLKLEVKCSLEEYTEENNHKSSLNTVGSSSINISLCKEIIPKKYSWYPDNYGKIFFEVFRNKH